MLPIGQDLMQVEFKEEHQGNFLFLWTKGRTGNAGKLGELLSLNLAAGTSGNW